MPKTKGVCVVRSRDGRFFEIPEDVLGQYQVQPHVIPPEERLEPQSRGGGDPAADLLNRSRGLIQIIINAPAESTPRVYSGRTQQDYRDQWVYQPPEIGAPMEWGDDMDPTGGMSSAARRG
jgi:hypothetical protein